MPSNQEPLTIGTATVKQRAEALSLVLSSQPAEVRKRVIADALGAGNYNLTHLDTLLIASRSAEMVGACWAQIMPGRAAIMWPPQLFVDESVSVQRRLLSAANTAAAGSGVRIAQAVLALDDRKSAVLFSSLGYQCLADFAHMASPAEAFPDEPPNSPIRFESFAEQEEPRMVRIVEQTYQQTLDCPQLDGAREISDVLDGYRRTGDYRPDHWFFARHLDEDVGCLLLTNHARDGQSELLYMGLVPNARGNGWGQRIARFAQWIARQTETQRLVLAVDLANLPAMNTYKAVGFSEFDRKRVYVRLFSTKT